MSMSREEAERMLGPVERCHNCGRETEWAYCCHCDKRFIKGHVSTCHHNDTEHIGHLVKILWDFIPKNQRRSLDIQLDNFELDNRSRKSLRNHVLREAKGDAVRATQILTEEFGYIQNL